MSAPIPRLSVATPCYNEAEGIEAVVAEWNRVLATMPQPSEIVLCNDGSTDGTEAALDRLQTRTPRLRVVHVRLASGCTVERSVIMDGATVEQPITIRDSLVFPGVTVSAAVDLSRAIVLPDQVIECR